MRKVIDNLGYLGAVVLLASLLQYALNSVWSTLVQVGIYGGLGLIAFYLAAKAPEISRALGTRGGKQGSSAGLVLLLVLGILGLANFLNYRHHERVDLSEGSLNSLSEQSIQLATNLNRDVHLIGFFTDPGQAQSFEEVVQEYRFSSTRISYDIVDPQKDPGKVSQYAIERSGQIVVTSGDNSQTLDSFDEQQITNAIIRVTRDEQKAVYFLQGHGERSLSGSDADGYLAIQGAIEKQNYQVSELNLAVGAVIPEDAKILIVAGPKSNFLPGEQELIEAYLATGGKLFLLVDPDSGFQMNDFLGRYGIHIADNTLIDTSLESRLAGLGPAAPLVSSYASHPITENLLEITFFPFARGLELVESELGYDVTTLFSSSGRTWGEVDLEGEEVEFNQGRDKQGPLAMAMLSSKPLQDLTSDDVSQQPLEDLSEDSKPEPESRVLVIGDSDFAANQYVDAVGNSDLFLNIVSWLAEDEDLVAVRPKDPTRRQVTLTARDSRLLLLGSVVFLPLAVLVTGISIWYRRR